MSVATLLGRLQQRLGGSDTGARLAVLVRNQCQSVLRARLAEGPGLECNGEAWLVRQVAPSAPVFFDIGANVGDWTALYLASADRDLARGILIDPSAGAIAALRRRFTGTPAVEVLHAGASDSPGEAAFFEEPECGTHSSFVREFARGAPAPARVRLTTVAHEAELRGLDRIDFLKVDCEGYDLHVLRGAGRLLDEGRIGVVQFEYNAPWAQAGSTLAAALRLLVAAAYDTYLLKSDGLHRLRYERYGEYFDYSNFVAFRADRDHGLGRFIRGPI